jgi:hypothetical protein
MKDASAVEWNRTMTGDLFAKTSYVAKVDEEHEYHGDGDMMGRIWRRSDEFRLKDR